MTDLYDLLRSIDISTFTYGQKKKKKVETDRSRPQILAETILHYISASSVVATCTDPSENPAMMSLGRSGNLSEKLGKRCWDSAIWYVCFEYYSTGFVLNKTGC